MLATQVILPALGMAQETGTIVRWLKTEGQEVTKGEPLVEIETDKATVELEAPASGILARVTGIPGVAIPVGHEIASILAPKEEGLKGDRKGSPLPYTMPQGNTTALPVIGTSQGSTSSPGIIASPLATRIAAENNVELTSIQPARKRIQKADVLAHIQNQHTMLAPTIQPRLLPASPKARKLASEQGKDLTAIQGSGPGGAVLISDVLKSRQLGEIVAPIRSTNAAQVAKPGQLANDASASTAAQSGKLQGVRASHSGGTQGEGNQTPGSGAIAEDFPLSNIWRIMAERTTQSWTSTPHFYLVREVNANRLIAWREQILKRPTLAEKVTYSDLLLKMVAVALRMHPRVNASWSEGRVVSNAEVHIGLAVAIEEGLVVPVIHQADKLGLTEIARQRKEMVTKAQSGKLRPQDISNGTFTISNLGMFNVDAFNAIINAPQAAILAVGRITERVVPIQGQPAVQPMMMLTLSCDHRVIDGARGAQFLDTLASLIEEPLELLDTVF